MSYLVPGSSFIRGCLHLVLFLWLQIVLNPWFMVFSYWWLSWTRTRYRWTFFLLFLIAVTFYGSRPSNHISIFIDTPHSYSLLLNDYGQYLSCCVCLLSLAWKDTRRAFHGSFALPSPCCCRTAPRLILVVTLKIHTNYLYRNLFIYSYKKSCELPWFKWGLSYHFGFHADVKNLMLSVPIVVSQPRGDYGWAGCDISLNYRRDSRLTNEWAIAASLDPWICISIL